MNSFQALTGITRRALRLNYVSPLICELTEETSSGSSCDCACAIGDFTGPTQQLGPVLSISELEGGASLVWLSAKNTVYSVFRATAEVGPFTVVANNVGLGAYFDFPGTGTWYYYVKGVEPSFGATTPSNVVTITLF